MLLRWRETLALVIVDEEAGEVAGEVVEETFGVSEMMEAGKSDKVNDVSEALMGAISS